MNDFNYTGRISRKLLGQYALSLFSCLGLICFLAAASIFFFGTFTFWRNSIILTLILYFCRDYMLLIFLLSLGFSWLVCTIHFIRLPLDYLDEMVEAAEQLTQPDDEPIILSPELSILEEHLNWTHSQALRNQRAAKEAEQRKNDLVVYLAHDLKTPLTSVIGYLTLLRDEPDLSPALRTRYTGVALNKAERLEDLINEFFDITRFNLTRMELEKRPCDLSRMLQQVVSEFSPMLEEHDLTAVLSLPETLPIPVIRISWPGSSTTSCGMPATTALRVPQWKLAPGRKPKELSSLLSIPVLPSPKTSCPVFLSSFSAWIPPAPPARAARGLAWPSLRKSSSFMGEPSLLKAAAA